MEKVTRTVRTRGGVSKNLMGLIKENITTNVECKDKFRELFELTRRIERECKKMSAVRRERAEKGPEDVYEMK